MRFELTKAEQENAEKGKLKVNDVLTIRKKLEEGTSVKFLAGIYRVSRETIRRIQRKETWDWLRDESEMQAASQNMDSQLAMLKQASRQQKSLLGDEPEEQSGLARLNAEAEKIVSPDALLKELETAAQARAADLLGTGKKES